MIVDQPTVDQKTLAETIYRSKFKFFYDLYNTLNNGTKYVLGIADAVFESETKNSK